MPSKPKIEMPAPVLGAEVEPETELIGKFPVSRGPLVLVDLQTLDERWTGRPDHPACIYVEGDAAAMAAIRPSLNRFDPDLEVLEDCAWRIPQSNRLVADHNLGAIRRFILEQGYEGKIKAFIKGAKTGPGLAIDLARKGAGVHNERLFNLAAFKVASDAEVTVERRGNQIILTLD